MTVIVTPEHERTSEAAPLHTDKDTAFVCRLLFSCDRLPKDAWNTLPPALQDWSITVRAYLQSRVCYVGGVDGADVDVAKMLYRRAFRPALVSYLAGREREASSVPVLSRCGAMMEAMTETSSATAARPENRPASCLRCRGINASRCARCQGSGLESEVAKP